MYALASQGQTAAEALAFYRTVIAKGPCAEEADPSVKARSGRHVQLQRLLALLWCDSERVDWDAAIAVDDFRHYCEWSCKINSQIWKQMGAHSGVLVFENLTNTQSGAKQSFAAAASSGGVVTEEECWCVDSSHVT